MYINLVFFIDECHEVLESVDPWALQLHGDDTIFIHVG